MAMEEKELESIWSVNNRKLINLFLLFSLIGQVILALTEACFIDFRSAKVFFYAAIPQLILWYCIYRKDKNAITASLSFLFQMLICVPNIYPEYFLGLGFPPEHFMEFYLLISLILNYFCFHLYSKFTYPLKTNSWLFGLLGLLFSSSIFTIYSLVISLSIVDFYQDITYLYFYPNLLEFQLIEYQNLLDFFVSIGLKCGAILIFLKFRQIAQSKSDFNYKMTTIFETTDFSKRSFIFYFLLLRSVLIFSAATLLNMYMWDFIDAPISNLIIILIIIASVYLFGSIYRNLIVLFFRQQGYTPKWLFLAIQVPILGLLFLIIMLNRPSKHATTQTLDVAEDVIDNVEMILANDSSKPPQKSIETVEVMRAITFTLSFIGLAYSLFYIPQNITGNEKSIVFLILASATYLFIYKEFGIYILLTIQIGALIQYYYEPSALMLVFVTNIAIMKIVATYPIFHYDQFTFVPYQSIEDQSEPVDNEIEL
jgi:hypothetical protein